jgi:hypothetical protein
MMLEKLPENLDETLRIIANEEQIAMPLDDIRKLLLMSLITHKLGGGWMVNSKGREYLKRNKK